MLTWALVVGINKYPDQAKQKVLQGAVADACDFAEWALDPAGGNVEPERLFFWTYPWPLAASDELAKYLARKELPLWDRLDSDPAPPDVKRPPRAMEIATTIESEGRKARTGPLVREDQETLRVYVFLAGHGIRAKNVNSLVETCFLAGDFRPTSANLVAGLVPCESLRRALLTDRFHEAILFTDCCRGSTSRTRLVAQPVSDYDGEPTQPFSIAYAAQDDKLAYETTTAPVRGAFSSALMRGLRTHRIGAAEKLHAKPLREYVQEKIKDFTTNDQMPNVNFNCDPDGPLIVSGAPAATLPPGPLVDVSKLASGTRLSLHGGDDKPVPGVDEFVVANGPWRLPALAPGLYLIQLLDGSGSYVPFRHPSPEPVHVG